MQTSTDTIVIDFRARRRRHPFPCCSDSARVVLCMTSVLLWTPALVEHDGGCEQVTPHMPRTRTTTCTTYGKGGRGRPRVEPSGHLEDDTATVSELSVSSSPKWRDGGYDAASSFGSVTMEEHAKVTVNGWQASYCYCCDCVPMRYRERNVAGDSGEAFGAGLAENAEHASPKRPNHRRGRSAGAAVRHGLAVPPGISEYHISSQPRDREHNLGQARTPAFHSLYPAGSSSGTTSKASSIVSEATATAAQCSVPAAGHARVGFSGVIIDGSGAASKGVLANGGRRSGSWGGTSALDREFHVILRAGVDVYKHATAQHSKESWKGVVPKRWKSLWSRKRPMDDASRGLVTLFMDKERERICWCPPGAAELVPDPIYVLNVHEITEVVPGYELRPRCVSLRSSTRQHPLVFEVDSDDLYDILFKGFARILERNSLGDSFVAPRPDDVAVAVAPAL